jgi:hypothetical protein
VERRKSREPTKVVLVSVLFMVSMLCVVVCGGCKTTGRGLPMPGRLSGQGEELKSINGKLYDYLQILLWVGMNNYDSCEDDQLEGYGLKNRKPGIGTGNPGSGMPRDKEIGKLALGGYLEIVGLPDDNERILANNMDGEGVTRLVRDAKALKTRKERLVGGLGSGFIKG